ncbi:XRE family transcriptional regulator [Bdellovibrio bacteriovorus]|uniref:XRE family transcriptional regulator n=1 Tax=Bdellovibrio bacteriovorus TaxID=959 RepID=UPI0021D09B1C|nr:XRE family transcriptional regulator [Bdellovibrio bacteriovorus]UXR64701.1 XRE family transcriptional regulator [Bdellovibrio bacteriovorus]
MLENQNLDWNKESLHDLRLRLGWSRSDLARRLHCSSEDVEALETGHRSIEGALKGQLEILRRQAEACCDEVMCMPAAEAELDKTALEQIDFARVKADLE